MQFLHICACVMQQNVAWLIVISLLAVWYEEHTLNARQTRAIDPRLGVRAFITCQRECKSLFNDTMNRTIPNAFDNCVFWCNKVVLEYAEPCADTIHLRDCLNACKVNITPQEEEACSKTCRDSYHGCKRWK